MSREKRNIALFIGILLLGLLIASSIFNLPSLNPIDNPKENDTLTFFLQNWGDTDHEVTVKIFDQKNNSIFNESYVLTPGERIKSPVITSMLGMYRYEVTLDNNITKTQTAEVRYAEDVSGSDVLFIDIAEQSNDSLHLGIAIP
ncbi:hypothetical protein [Methanohalophilus sp.]